MTPSVKIYGFGSHFQGKEAPRDIDLLLLHPDTSKGSIAYAIRCKALLKKALPSADIVMLSVAEEAENDFIVQSKARKLHFVDELDPDSMLLSIAKSILTRIVQIR